MLSPHRLRKRLHFWVEGGKVSKSSPHRLEPGIFHSMKAKRETKTLRKKAEDEPIRRKDRLNGRKFTGSQPLRQLSDALGGRRSDSMQITQGACVRNSPNCRLLTKKLVFFTKTNSKAGGLWGRVGKGKRTQEFHIHRQERSSCPYSIFFFKSWIRGLKVGKVGRRKLGVGLLVPS